MSRPKYFQGDTSPPCSVGSKLRGPGVLALVWWGTIICMGYCASEIWVQRWALGHLLPLGLAVAEREWSLLQSITKALLCAGHTIFIM